MAAVILLLVLGGFVLLAVEVLVIPGFGVSGILGIGAMAAGGVLSWTTYGAFWGIGVVSGTFLGAIVLLWMVAKSKVGKSMELNNPIEGNVVTEDLEALVGSEGVAVSILRPAGRVLFGDEKRTVVAEGQFVKKGTAVRVLRIDAGAIVVEPVETQQSDAPDVVKPVERQSAKTEPAHGESVETKPVVKAQ